MLKSLPQPILCICLAGLGSPAWITCLFSSNFILCLRFPKRLGQTNVVLLMKNAYILVKWILLSLRRCLPLSQGLLTGWAPHMCRIYHLSRVCTEACKDPALTLFPSNRRKPSHTPLFFLCQQDCSNLWNLQNVCYHHNKPYIPRCYLQPDNHSPAGLVPDMSLLGTSVLWKPHRNVIQGLFDNGTNHLIIEEDIKWCVACWSMKK